MTTTVDIDALQVGMFVHLDLGWWAHPFALSSFVITSTEQIDTLRGLGLKRLRWSPDKSQLAEAHATAGDDGAGPDRPVVMAAGAEQVGANRQVVTPITAPTGPDAETAQRRASLAAQREAERLCAAQLSEARQAFEQVGAQLVHAPEAAREIAEGLTRGVLAKLLDAGDHGMCVRVLADVPGDAGAAHALNVMVVSLMVGQVCGLEARQLHQLGLGALLHDIGKFALPARAQHAGAGANPADEALYRGHVALGLTLGERMGLDSAVLAVIGQHHEMADRSGFPRQIGLDDMGRPARIVALVNRYDRLCNPHHDTPALTPHEALAALFAQSRSRFDAVVLSSFIRMMGVYPPGSTVQLTDERFATVVSVNPARPLKPRVLVCDLGEPADDALLVDLDQQRGLGIRRSLRPQQLPPAVRAHLRPQSRMVYFFEPVQLDQPAQALAARALAA